MLTNRWIKATKSNSNGNGGCLEVRLVAGRVEARDSKHPDGPVLVFTPAEWDCALDGGRRGEFDLPPGVTP